MIIIKDIIWTKNDSVLIAEDYGIMINSTFFTSIQKLYIQCCPAGKTTDPRVRKLNSSICSAICVLYVLCSAVQS